MPKKSEPKKNAFVSTILDKLSDIDVVCRPMFGAYGLYHQNLFFAIIWDHQLFFRTDDETMPKYIKAGIAPLLFYEKQKTRSYFEVPPQVMRSPKKLCEWALEAVDAQRRLQSKKAATKRSTRAKNSKTPRKDFDF